MQYLAIALVWVAFVLFIISAKKQKKSITIAFLVAMLLALVALYAWGVARNF